MPAWYSISLETLAQLIRRSVSNAGIELYLVSRSTPRAAHPRATREPRNRACRTRAPSPRDAR
jgi:hypothetical protein